MSGPNSLAILFAFALVVVAAVWLVGDLPGSGQGSVSANPESSGQVRWIIESEPTGAQVIRDDNQQVLGTTRYDADRPRSTGEIKLRIRADGYSDQTVIANGNANLSTTVYLNKLSPTPPPVEQKPAAAVATPTNTVKWEIAGRPKHATVKRVADDQVLGETPLTLLYPAGPGTVKVVLQAPGYFDQVLILDQSSAMDMNYALKPLKSRPKKAREEEIPLFDSPEGVGSPTSASPDTPK